MRLFRRKRTAWPCQICISGYQFSSNHPDSKQFSVEMHRFRHIAGKTRQNVSVSTFELYSSHIIHIYIVFFVISFSIQEAIDGKINGSSRKVGGANNGLGEAPKSCTRKEHESATNSIAKRGQGGTSSLFVCPLQGQGTASLVGFGATPQLFRVRPIPRKPPTKVQAAKRPCQ